MNLRSCLSEKCLDCNTRSDDNNLKMTHGMKNANQLTNTKQGGVSIYYKKFLPERALNVLILNEFINLELKTGDKTGRF